MGTDFRLGDWIVRPQRRIIECGDACIHIKPKPMAVLECLAAAQGMPVSRNDLFDTVWPGGEVFDHTLNKCIAELRRAFGDSARDSRVIETIPKMGFRLILPVEPIGEEPIELEPSGSENQRSRTIVKQKLKLAAMLTISALLVLAILLLFDGPRSRLSNIVDTAFQNQAGDLVPQSEKRQPGLAVLPFVNMSEDTGSEYFSQGISEEILNSLAAANRVPVIARTSSFRFSAEGADIKEIGRLLNVSHVLEGSVRKADDQVRVSAQLFDTTTGLYVWADVYQGDMADILQLQIDITRQVVEQISLALGMPSSTATGSGLDGELATIQHTENIEAYELYLIGTQLLESYDPFPGERAVDYFERAIALDADYADAWVGKGRALHLLGLGGRGHPSMPADVFPQAIASYRRALEIEPRHATAMGWLGLALIQNDFKWVEGLQMIKRSVDLNPNNAAMLSRYGAWLKRLRLDGSEEILERAFHLDPFGFVTTLFRANQLQLDGYWADAAAMVETTLIGNRKAYAPNNISAFMNISAAAMGADDEQARMARLETAEAQILVARRVAHPIDFSLDVMEMSLAAIRNGTTLPWREILDRARTERLDRLLLYAFYTPWEDKTMMVEAFDLAIEQRDPELWLLFGSRPADLPEEDWRRMRETIGIAQFQELR